MNKKQQFQDRLIGPNRVIDRKLSELREWFRDNGNPIISIDRYLHSVDHISIIVETEAPFIANNATQELYYDYIASLFDRYIDNIDVWPMRGYNSISMRFTIFIKDRIS